MVVVWTTTMRPFVLLLSLLASSQSGLSRVGRADIVRGQGWAAPPPGYQLQAEVLSLSQAQPPRPVRQSGQTTKHRGHRQKPIKVISQFDTPNSFQPVKTFYNKDKYEPTTEQSFVSGPPLGDDFVERYQKMMRNSQKKSQLSFEGLLPDDLIERRKRKHQDPPVPAFYQIKSPVTLDFPSASFESFDFNPNGGWYGEKATGLAQVPKPNKIKRQPVTLDYISPSTGTFSPNNNWFGEAETGLLTSYPNHLLPKRQTVSLSRPSHQTSRDNFSPSGWKVYRDQVIETGKSTIFLNVKAMPPPMIISSTWSSMFSISWILSATLAPPRMARNGLSGLLRALEKYVNSFFRRNPAARLSNPSPIMLE